MAAISADLTSKQELSLMKAVCQHEGSRETPPVAEKVAAKKAGEEPVSRYAIIPMALLTRKIMSKNISECTLSLIHI